MLVAFCFVFHLAAGVKWFELEDYTFENYVQDFKKKYESPEELNFRRARFDAEVERVKKHNSDPTKTWKEGVNHLTDRTREEFGDLLGVRKDILYQSAARRAASEVKTAEPAPPFPRSVDWRKSNVVTAVKDQGQCGSCWTFATAETVESHWAINTGLLTDLSEQQILDCTPNPNECGGTGGCQGGTAELAFARLIAQGGLMTEWLYPYTSYRGSNFNCSADNVTTPFAKLRGYVQIKPFNKQNPIVGALVFAGPLAISVDASAWSAYESGVFDGCNQTNPDINHAVQLVGYDTDPTLGDFWIVRNSWAPSWGELGYIRLRKEPAQAPRCGTDVNPQDGTGCKGGPPTVQVCGTCGILYDVSYPIVKPRF